MREKDAGTLLRSRQRISAPILDLIDKHLEEKHSRTIMAIGWMKKMKSNFGASFLWLVCLIYFTQVSNSSSFGFKFGVFYLNLFN